MMSLTEKIVTAFYGIIFLSLMAFASLFLMFVGMVFGLGFVVLAGCVFICLCGMVIAGTTAYISLQIEKWLEDEQYYQIGGKYGNNRETELSNWRSTTIY